MITHCCAGSYPPSYYQSAIASGRILICGQQVSSTYKIQRGDELTHLVHRHEPAVRISNNTSTVSNSNILDAPPPIDILYEDDSLLVVDKPSTLPIHPCGAYHYNSLFEILSHWKPSSYGAGKLYTVYRLDRLTSGVVVLAKNAALARSLSQCIFDREGCEKIYLARVKGRFPLNLVNGKGNESWQFRRESIDAGGDSAISPPCINGVYSETNMKHWKGGVRVPLHSAKNSNAALGYWFSDENEKVLINVSWRDISSRASNVSALEILDMVKYESKTNQNKDQTNNTPANSITWLNFSCPCRVSSHKDGICEAGDFTNLTTDKDRKGIKPAQTSFSLLTYDALTDTSVVLAKPITGRTHQIRLHLQKLGHPIANDHCYGGDIMWCCDKESKDASDKAREWLNRHDNDSLPTTLSDIPATDSEINDVLASKQKGDNESTLDFIERTCVWCARSKGAAILSANGKNDTGTRRDLYEAVMKRTLMEYFVRSQGIWLHAWQYSLKLNGSNEFSSGMMCYRTGLPSWACISTLTDNHT